MALFTVWLPGRRPAGRAPVPRALPSGAFLNIFSCPLSSVDDWPRWPQRRHILGRKEASDEVIVVVLPTFVLMSVWPWLPGMIGKCRGYRADLAHRDAGAQCHPLEPDVIGSGAGLQEAVPRRRSSSSITGG